jgi:cytochrome c peroxidase
MKLLVRPFFFWASTVLALVGCASRGDGSASVDALRVQVVPLFGTVQPVSAAEVNAPQAVLGRALFWDSRLSANGTTACASCHTRDAWSADSRRVSVTGKGQATALHSQPMFMAQDQAALRWYGDRRDGAHQAERSITGSMGLSSPAEMMSLLLRFGYEGAFGKAFAADADPVTPANYAKALVAYQRTLRNPAPFDAFLAGDSRALSAQQRAGLQKFVANGCVACHSGPLLGGQSFQKFGIVKDYWLATGSAAVDQGRFNSTQKEEDRFVFRVAMLRNVSRTAPYFHDGSVDTLEHAVRVMAEVQLGRQLSGDDVADIVAFLGALTGPIPNHYAPP